jgi:hypothetical protein
MIPKVCAVFGQDHAQNQKTWSAHPFRKKRIVLYGEGGATCAVVSPPQITWRALWPA